MAQPSNDVNNSNIPTDSILPIYFHLLTTSFKFRIQSNHQIQGNLPLEPNIQTRDPIWWVTDEEACPISMAVALINRLDADAASWVFVAVGWFQVDEGESKLKKVCQSSRVTARACLWIARNITS